MKNILLSFFISYSLCAQVIPLNTTTKVLNKNMVKANINTVNTKFWKAYSGGTAAYEVPAGSSHHAQFANSIWIGGLDRYNILHVAANTYRQKGVDFWPGPLDTTSIGAYNSTNTAVYNKLWKVDCADINSFVNAFSNGWVANNTYTVPADILNYPAKGVGNFQKNLEPFMDANNNGLYNPATEGDYPLIKGHQQILSIYNDTLKSHTETGAPAMGIEIHERAYAYSEPGIHDTMQAINYTTFYHYTIYNRSAYNYFNVYLTDWSDVDLGYYLNDYIGTDSLNNFTYCYNAGTTDPNSGGVYGYGSRLPVVSHALIKTNCQGDGVDNDNDSQTDEPGEQFNMNRSTYYNNNIGSFPPSTTNPGTAQEYYGYMSGYWKDGTPFTFGGTGYGNGSASPMVYSGDPAGFSGWTEAGAGNTPGDRRVLTTSGPFTFPAGSRIEWGYAIVFSQDTAQGNTISSFSTRVRRDVRNIRLYDEAHQAPQCTPAITTGLLNIFPASFDALVYPNPARESLEVLLLKESSAAVINIFDLTGREIMTGTVFNSNRISFDLSGIQQGVYLVQVSCDGKTLCRKFIKE